MAKYCEMNIDDTSAFLGLERYLSDTTTQEILYQRQLHSNTVLYQHRQQIEIGVYDAEELARTSEATSEWSRMRARLIGKLHAC